jgi:hypothetical protein
MRLRPGLTVENPLKTDRQKRRFVQIVAVHSGIGGAIAATLFGFESTRDSIEWYFPAWSEVSKVLFFFGLLVVVFIFVRDLTAGYLLRFKFLNPDFGPEKKPTLIATLIVGPFVLLGFAVTLSATFFLILIPIFIMLRPGKTVVEPTKNVVRRRPEKVQNPKSNEERHNPKKDWRRVEFIQQIADGEFTTDDSKDLLFEAVQAGYLISVDANKFFRLRGKDDSDVYLLRSNDDIQKIVPQLLSLKANPTFTRPSSGKDTGALE